MNECTQSELTRRAYLGALGIIQYEARAPLPFAAPSVVIPWPEDAAEPDSAEAQDNASAVSTSTHSTSTHPTEQISSQSPTVTGSTPQRAGAMSEDDTRQATVSYDQANDTDLQNFRVKPPAELSQKNGADKKSRVAAGTASENVFNFALFIGPPVQQVLLVAELSNSGVPGDLSPLESRFLDDVLRALKGSSGLLPEGRCFKWPITSNARIGKDKAAGLDALQEFLDHWCEAQAVKTVVLLSDTPWLAEDKALKTSNGVFNVIQVPSVQSLEQDWQQKRRLWQTLQQSLQHD